MTSHPAADDCLAETHEVLNQPTPLVEFNAWTSDAVLRYWIARFGGAGGAAVLESYGARVGGDLQRAGFLANRHKPEFTPHDRFGHRVDLVEYHPAYHALMAAAIGAGHHALPWREPGPGAHVVRAGIEFLHTQADPGTGCPLTMTFASVPALRHQPALAARWLPRITALAYDPRNVPHTDKAGLTIGMAMTEKQGGSDVRANTTRAVPIGDDDGVPTFRLVGHKWFCSAPMCDAFLVLAYTDVGLSCFLVPRWRPDGGKNPLQIQRLKDKLGNVSNASSEIELRGAFGWLIGAEGRGVRTILDMVAMTRFDCMVGSAAQLAQGAREAIHHTGGRSAFGRRLHEQPLMLNVLADLALEAEAALAIALRLAHALDRPDDDHEAALVRLGTALGKYWICKRAPQHAYECMESIGAVGLIKDNVAARLYADAPVNAIWEGSGNVQCLDVLRVIARHPEALEALMAELGRAAGRAPAFDAWVARLQDDFADREQIEYRSRALVERLALAWQAATLLNHGEADIAAAFVAARLAGGSGLMYGTLPPAVDCRAIVMRARPVL
ncbi:MAG: acyl-CoA dehydrogenase family protein [Gammaproteobacteria bacterium]|nr:acyl-CoA dehydrogenase family protein [Gammaproteobacteria bacterium]